ncbi:hypothetical protein GIB67_023110 [Kingdonia uniflora]|uniref:BHLH domain-containing protein n=1 Tax=Kingdonia uniflora TaxID=39325 RepID=A0A7J7M5L2_9MAGN|nr:hypothetical protein GIB67_023110 [Kingdonia uniflora]
MLALSPLFVGWPLEDQMTHEQHWGATDPFMDFNYRNPEISESSHPFSPSQPETQANSPRFSGATSSGPLTDKKLTHNACERDRRKKLNTLYSSLQSLLPGTNHTKKLSIPATISRVVKYISELQSHVERLVQKKEEMLSSISKQGEISPLFKQENGAVGWPSLPSVLTSRVDDRGVVIQICTYKVNRSPFSDVLLSLENENFEILNASAFASTGNRVFYNLHLQVKETQRIECEMLREKLINHLM